MIARPRRHGPATRTTRVPCSSPARPRAGVHRRLRHRPPRAGRVAPNATSRGGRHGLLGVPGRRFRLRGAGPPHDRRPPPRAMTRLDQSPPVALEALPWGATDQGGPFGDVARDRTAGAADSATARLAFALQDGSHRHVALGPGHGHIERDSSMDSPHVLSTGRRRRASRSTSTGSTLMTGRTSAALRGDRREAATLTTEHRIVRPDGEVRWLQAKAHVSFAPDGSPVSVVGVVVDITDRRKTERDRDAAVAARERPFAGRAPSSGASPSCHGPPTCSTPRSTSTAPAQVAYLAIGVIADWCTVDLLTDGRIHHAAVAHRDPAMVARARRVKEQYPQDVDEPTFRHIITSLEPLFVEVFDDRPHRRHRPGPRVPPDPARVPDELVPRRPAHRRRQGHWHHHARRLPRPAHRPRRREPRRRPRPPCRGRRREDPPLRSCDETAQVLQSSLLPANLPDIPGVTPVRALPIRHRGPRDRRRLL